MDFFLGRNYLVTIHDGRSRSIAKLKGLCDQHERILAEGPVALLHRIVDSMVDNYRPEIEALETHMNALEDEAILGRRDTLVRDILELKRDLASLRRIVIPQRDAVGRLARREFPIIGDEMAYRFRDVYDQFVRLADEATLFQDRVTGILDAHLSSISNRLNIGDEGADGHVDDLSAADRADRHVGNERGPALAPRWRRVAILVDRWGHGGHFRHHARSVQTQRVALVEQG